MTSVEAENPLFQILERFAHHQATLEEVRLVVKRLVRAGQVTERRAIEIVSLWGLRFRIWS